MAGGGIERLIFFGTPELAVPTLEALVAAGRRPAAVVTRPPRPAGRGQRLEEPAVARTARALGLPVLQPERVRSEPFLAEVAALRPDAAVVVAFGQVFPRALLDLPAPHGCINLHASLLPRWRGAAPIQAAIAAGDRTTGVSTMRMEQGLDTGPVLLQEAVAIGEEETAGELSKRLAQAGAGLVLRTLAALAAGTAVATPQDDEQATYAPRLSRASGQADWSLPAAVIADRRRAYTPWPGVWATLREAPIKVVAAVDASAGGVDSRAAPGTILGLAGGRLAVACGAGTVLGIEALQRPGRRALPAADFANGERLRVSDCASLADATLLHAGLRLLRQTPRWDGFVRLVDATGRQRGFGDYYGYGLIAEGKAELYVEVDLKPWDIAAVKILVEEAGGRLTDLAGRSNIYDGTVLASNGRLHAAALRLLTGS